MSDEGRTPPEQVPDDTPASPHPDSPHRHGDALLEESGSRHGEPPEESALEEDPSDDR
jgi:hypothetical protein